LRSPDCTRKQNVRTGAARVRWPPVGPFRDTELNAPSGSGQRHRPAGTFLPSCSTRGPPETSSLGRYSPLGAGKPSIATFLTRSFGPLPANAAQHPSKRTLGVRQRLRGISAHLSLVGRRVLRFNNSQPQAAHKGLCTAIPNREKSRSAVHNCVTPCAWQSAAILASCTIGPTTALRRTIARRISQ